MSTILPRLLIVDDEVQILRLVRHVLEHGGFQVHEAGTGSLALGEAATLRPEAIILDLGLPDLDGLKVLRRLREWSKVPVLILTIRNSEDDVIAALDEGADDYLTKPFRPRELLARVRAMLRRAHKPEEEVIVRFGEIEVDLSGHIVKKSGEKIHLTAKEYALLRLLVQHRGKVVTHGQLLRDLWGPNSEHNTHYLRVYITYLRQKLETNPRTPAFLKTEAGIGYRLIAE